MIDENKIKLYYNDDFFELRDYRGLLKLNESIAYLCRIVISLFCIIISNENINNLFHISSLSYISLKILRKIIY